MRALAAAGGCVLFASVLLFPDPQRIEPASGEAALRRALERGSGTVLLPPGELVLTSELRVPDGAHDLEIRGPGATLKAAPGFRARGLLVIRSAARVRLSGFSLDGNRQALARPVGLPPSDVPFVRFYESNGIVAEDVDSLTIENVSIREVANFPVLIARGRNVRLERLDISDSGSRDARGLNNTTGGILLEEGTAGFEVRGCRLRNVLGNGVWTHSLYTSPRNRDGVIAENEFRELARDAIQVGHATNVRVERNRGARIGYPVADVDPYATPVAIDTAGDTDRSSYIGNRFEEINGKCIDLDGFHHGEVRRNVCINRGPRAAYPHGHFGIVLNNTNPDMQSEAIVIAQNVVDGAVFGGLFLIGSGHTVTANRFLNLNLAGCDSPAKPGCLFWPDEPDLLRSGIYLGQRAERLSPARGNRITGNEIGGLGMEKSCFGAAPGVPLRENTIAENRCKATNR